MPSMKPDVSGGGGTSIAIAATGRAPRTAALTPYIEDTLRSPIRVIRYQPLPEIRPPQSAVHLPPVTVPDAIARVPAGSFAFSVAVVRLSVRSRTPPQVASSGR